MAEILKKLMFSIADISFFVFLIMKTMPKAFIRAAPNKVHSHCACRGFTMIELIMVIVIIGVLAVFALPRAMSSDDVNARGFHDQTLSFLRFAQKTAIAKRRTVCVTLAAQSVTLSIASAAQTANCSGGQLLPGPTGPSVLSARGSVAFDADTPLISINFNALGQPGDDAGELLAKQTLQVEGASKQILIEAQTGYVHD